MRKNQTKLHRDCIPKKEPCTTDLVELIFERHFAVKMEMADTATRLELKSKTGEFKPGDVEQITFADQRYMIKRG